MDFSGTVNLGIGTLTSIINDFFEDIIFVLFYENDICGFSDIDFYIFEWSSEKVVNSRDIEKIIFCPSRN
jgi:hypothetical protein